MSFDIKRVVLYVALAFFASQLWASWQRQQTEYQQKQAATTLQATGLATTDASMPKQDLPAIQASAGAMTDSSAATVPSSQSQPTPIDRLVWVKTDTLRVAIDTQGGNIVRAELLDYPESLRQQDIPVQVLDDNPQALYIAQSGLISKRGPDTGDGQVRFQTSSSQYELASGENELVVRLAWRNDAGVLVDKLFTFTRGKYLVDVAYQIQNRSSQEWTGNFYTQFKRKEVKPKKQGMFYINPYRGGSYSNPEEKVYNKLPFSKMAKENLSQNITGGWVAMQDHYFLSAWVPNQDEKLSYYSKAPKAKSSDKNPDYFILGMYTNPIQVAPNQTKMIGSKLYLGPELSENLKTLAPGLELTVDYGFLWPIAVLIMWMMKKINFVLGNWGWSILAITLIIKLMFYHLSAKTYKSMARQKELAPRIEQLRSRFAEDKQAFSQAMIELYRKEKVNPLGGCLPMLVQIPVFIALYWVLVESVEFRQAPFMLWIQDLSAPDPFYILPLLMGLTMWVQQKLNPPPPDPTQRKMLMALPVVFTVLFLYFPAGLVLYFAANNALSVLQQWYVMRGISTRSKKAAPSAS